MARDTITEGGGERSATPLEIYGRKANGQYLPRLALANQLLKCVNVEVTNIQIHAGRPLDLTPVFEALRALPLQLQHQALLKSYKGVLNLYESYLHHGDELYLKDVLLNCANEVPGFDSALAETLQTLVPDPYDYRFRQTHLEPLNSLCNSYLGMLAYNFHAVTIYHPATAANEPVIQGFVNRAIMLLKTKLGETLRPNGAIQGSLYLEAFHEVDTDRFERYLAYDDRNDSSRSIRTFVANANRNESWENEVRLAKPKVDDSSRWLADKLIELIDRFQALNTAKNSFDPQVNDEPGLPIET
ncbi:hypothetical protein CD58_19360 [Pseudomonas brassicacearum]|jgi:hypothetical protein|uniref:Uncharacterized protein n=1 Tax=Pseudomonas frederiksbergensis TaxID=104087 RepID=A0A0B1ZBM0_9PSED|nr:MULTISPECIES: hypothetical protein [Pseudomonas]AHL36927.1 hypothetical protein CD58_19360 [Pseudomonas brassicacearum]KHK66708.1 hypothetical protein JZ00_02380 [Pseudomonas frederiksbergensis]